MLLLFFLSRTRTLSRRRFQYNVKEIDVAQKIGLIQLVYGNESPEIVLMEKKSSGLQTRLVFYVKFKRKQLKNESFCNRGATVRTNENKNFTVFAFR